MVRALVSVLIRLADVGRSLNRSLISPLFPSSPLWGPLIFSSLISSAVFHLAMC